MSKTEIPPTWKFEGNASENLKKLLIAQMIGFAGHKGEIAKLLTDLVGTTIINGHLVYNTNINLKGLTCNTTSNQSKLLKLLIGIDDTGLASICSSNADNVRFNWRKRNAFAKEDFANAITLLKSRLTNVSTIEIDSTMISYWSEKQKNNPEYIAGYWTEACPECIPPIESEWIEPVGEEFIPMEYSDRVPIDFRANGNTAFTNDLNGQTTSGTPFALRYMEGGFTYPESEIYRDTSMSLIGIYEPTLIFRNTSGVDITSNYDDKIKLAVISMILISGSNFMSEIGSISKVSETLTDGGLSYIVTGRQIYSANINQSFIDDISSTYWYSYTQAVSSSTDRIFPPVDTESGGSEYVRTYGRHIWNWRDENLIDLNIETNSNGLFITTSTLYSSGEIYLTVEGFKRCSYSDYGKWIFAMANISQTMNSSGFLGIGGFFGDLLKGIVSIVGIIIETIIDVFKEISLLTLKITGIYYILIEVGLEDYIDLITEITAHTALAVLTLGASEYASLAYAGVEMAEIGISEISYLATEHLLESGIVNIAGKTISTVGGVVKSEASNRADEKQRRKASQSDKELEDALEEYKSLSGNKESSNQSNEELINELNFNPFKRLEVKEKMKYDSYNSFDKLDPYKRILN